MDEAGKEITRTERLVVKTTAKRGRGVFAAVLIREGEVVETCPVIVVPPEETPAAVESVLGDYLFQWGGTREASAIALGFGSLYNHAAEPNAVYVRKEGVLDFVALRDIAEGEEITVSYNGAIGDREPVWFDVT